MRDEYQLKALMVLMISGRILMRITEGGTASLGVKSGVLRIRLSTEGDTAH